MADLWNSFKVREFEHLLAGPTVALLRVSGRPTRRRPTTASRPILLADDGQAIRRFVAIPAPPDERGVLRAAYAVTPDLVATSTSFSLELADGTIIALPAPQPGLARLIPEPADDPASQAAEDPEPPEGIDERRSGLLSQLTELSARVAESEQARAELETWSAELERRLTETVDELSAARAARTNDEAAVLRLGGELAEAEAKAELLQSEVETLGQQLAEPKRHQVHPATEDSLAVARAEIDDLRAQLAQAREAETQATIEAVRHAAEAQARELAERELASAQAVSADE